MTETPTGPGRGYAGPPGAYGRLGDRYEIGGVLGSGGMAEVRIGRDLRLGRTVAIKRLRIDLASDPTFLARFRREAQSAAALNHPSIVAVYDTGEATGPDGHTVPFIVMEYVEGKTLRDLLREMEREGRKILPERTLEITADILAALDYSHRAGIIHRDIKPANVMLTPSGQVKVMDFGIARAIADTSSAMTQTAAVVGTAQYLSPEQARGETVDARSDIYSTGCLLYELLTGRPPFQGDSPLSVALQHVREEAPPPSTFNPEVTPVVDRVVAKALAKRTDERYQSAAEMRADIERVLAGQPTAASAAPTAQYAAVPAAPATEALPPANLPPAAGDEEDGKSRRWVWILSAIAALLVVGLAAWGIPELMGKDDTTETPKVAMPDVVGMGQAAAERKLTGPEFGFTVGEIKKTASADVDAGKVISTDPAPGIDTPKGDKTTVTMVVSTGPERVEVPYLVGLKLKAAREQLKAAGLTYEVVVQESDAPKNEVLKTDPVPGEPVDPGTSVTLTVSAGKSKVPDVVGKMRDEAEAILEDAGFKVRVFEQPSSDQPAGTVTEQIPGADAEADPGAQIILTVSSGPETTDPTDPGVSPVPEAPTIPDGEG
ncbi:Stk1 family PASTA domain-containing Ser/Thr kinase [Mumia sp. zg.B53]|uniref:Stk1 family PASTA domain-containing Ser/Thr kinase n=1 Tax=unclassified Mumia TaxID=2621872 RepID=UPI001C6E4A77|nr:MULTISPECIES: Stk1 family PASTA domain-containing Ser/Thr kinase [unclassified Mumia]MBW9207696.1 Stk1 family PASTA domain-containing Ser/Thr kinase [Mumia sp. zg.B17]MBW9214562.1 Stk1 family PASTA domain-containing Ser/Thr kinase [Mumia sp. zg.B53]